MTDLKIPTETETSLPFYKEVNPIIIKGLEKEFSCLQEMSKLFMLKYANSISLIYKNKLNEKIQVNPKLDCFETGFNSLIYGMKKKFFNLMKNELEKLKDFFYDFVQLKEKDYIFGKLFKKNFQDEFCLETYSQEKLKKVEEFLFKHTKIEQKQNSGNKSKESPEKIKDYEIQETGSEMSHLDFDQSPHSTIMAKKRNDNHIIENLKKSPNFAHEEVITPQRSVHKSPKFYKRSLDNYPDIENKNPNIEKIYQPQRERSKEKVVPRVPLPKPPSSITNGSSYKEVEPQQGGISGQRSPRHWESKHNYSGANSIKSHHMSVEVGDVNRNERFIKKDKSYYQNAGKSRRSREVLEEAQIEKYGGGRRSRERLSRRYMEVKTKEPDMRSSGAKIFDVVKKNLGEDDDYEVIDIQYDPINENLYYFSAKTNAIYKHNLKNGENTILLETNIPIENDSINPTQTIIQLDNEAGYLIAKTQKNELTFIDLLSPRKRISAEIEDESKIIFFKPFLNGNQDMLILTNEGIVKILSYKNLSIELLKTSDNLELEGEVTACSFNPKEMIFVINQFVDLERNDSVFKNSTRVYKIKLDSWIWIEFLSEFSSNNFQLSSEMNYNGKVVITTTRARGSHDFSTYVLNEKNQAMELVPSFGLKTAGILICKHYNNRLWVLSEDSTLLVISPLI